MPPCCDLPVEINKTTQTGKEWAKPEAALLPPDGGAGCGQGYYFPGWGFWMCISGGGPLCFVKNGEGGTKYQEG